MQAINSIIKMNSDIFTNAIKNNGVNNNAINNENVKNKNSNLEFMDVMENALNKVNQSQVNANNKIEALIKGDDVTMHDVMLSVQESQMSMQLMLEVRNKLFEAYQQVNGVQL